MKNKKMRDAFSYIDDSYLELVESEKSKRKPAWYYGSVAAACLVAGLLVFSTGVLAADWFGLRSLVLQKPDVDIDISDAVTAGQYSAALSKDHDIISLSGYTDSAEAQALAEWNEFLATYDPDGTILKENDKNPEYMNSMYFVYSEEMQDKLTEIAEKYGLKLHTDLDFPTADELATSVGGQFWTDCCDVESPYIYENGTFQYDSTCAADGFDYQFRRSVKGTFEEVDLNIGVASDYEEWQYKTASGAPLLLALGPDKALVFADFDNCFITVNVLAGTESGMSKETLQKFADSFDFGILENVTEPDMNVDSSSVETSSTETASAEIKSIQDELAEIELKSAEYENSDWGSMGQQDMNQLTAEWYQLWDDELNSLWSRLSDELDAETKAKVLEEQRAWITRKDENIKGAGAAVYGGSLQAQLENTVAEEMTRARAYVLAGYLAEVRNEAFTIPSEVQESIDAAE
jgi:uncharacterized protein YecT (DUF1311 family)